ncbi:LLM class flavin-dependent oxidoreductase [Actinoallomurus purpureus]|uniref:LLM class flavin-dependent oxidoreductase n=1 Tax=Actinoallomurus purpureus TaxID=478114 RepID=UPI00209374D5|nr:LLM class flavin-dependent oxidoreductase [Actinoallomurus purpureus]MCO6003644.1 LLM class flavin-dependent oxidoreductase [Actinoallomurus purpureus]
MARRLATLDHLSGGRAAWNVVSSFDDFTGENLRRGGYLEEADRYTRAAEFLQTARELWHSWRPDASWPTPYGASSSGPTASARSSTKDGTSPSQGTSTCRAGRRANR